MTKALLFDFDGTLADTAPGILLTMKETFKELGLPVPSDDAVKQTIGLQLVKGIQILGSSAKAEALGLPAGGAEPGRELMSDEEAAAAADVYRRFFPVFEITHITMFPGVVETLRELASRGIRMAICTSRGTDSLKRILTRHGLLDCFETFVTATDNLPGKPAPDMVLALLSRMGLSADEAIVVGDTTFDIGMGSGAGCRTIAVTYGNHSVEQLRSSAPTWIIDDFQEIPNLV